MGLAIIIDDISFAARKLGQVTIAQDVSLTSIAISGSDTIGANENSQTYTVVYNPLNTNQRGIEWSIESDIDDIATINGGVLTVEPTRNATTVVIKATSTSDSTIYATKTITVSAREASFWQSVDVVRGYWTTDGFTPDSEAQASQRGKYVSWNPMIEKGDYHFAPASGVTLRLLYKVGSTIVRTSSTYSSEVDLSVNSNYNSATHFAINIYKSTGISNAELEDPALLVTITRNS